MKKRIFTFLAAMLVVASASACTNLIVGKAASVDGSVMYSYSADSYGMFNGLAHFPAAKHKPGEMRKIYDWDTNVYHGEIPEAAGTYNVVGNINEYQLSIGETTYGGREEMVDTTGIIDYGSLIYITLQRARNAREAIDVMTRLVETYGYCSEGETFTIADPNEAWIMEMMGKGPGSKGVVWVARRIPDDCICAHANQSRIRQFPIAKRLNKRLNRYESEGCIYSADCIRFAREKGWYSGDDASFSWADAYAPADFGARRFCDARVWSFFNMYAEGGFADYLPWALGKDPDAKPMPLWIKPKRKLSVHDVETAMRDHYEGTPLSLDRQNDPGQGVWSMPYRPTPLSFEYEGEKYFNERPISTQQPEFTYVAQLRSWLPREIGGVLWFGNDDANMIAYTPVYCSMTKIPECYATPGADDTHFSMDNAYWVCNWVSNMVYPRYSMLFPSLEQIRDSLDNSYFDLQSDVEAEALKIYNQKGGAECSAYLNDYSIRQSQQMLKTWRELAIYLIVKFNDMAVKPEEKGREGQLRNDGQRGTFLVTPDGYGATVKRPGYNNTLRRAISTQTGDWYKVPKGDDAK